jgi:hypothetical protein
VGSVAASAGLLPAAPVSCARHQQAGCAAALVAGTVCLAQSAPVAVPGPVSCPCASLPSPSARPHHQQAAWVWWLALLARRLSLSSWLPVPQQHSLYSPVPLYCCPIHERQVLHPLCPGCLRALLPPPQRPLHALPGAAPRDLAALGCEAH